jgi:hypothetical protein
MPIEHVHGLAFGSEVLTAEGTIIEGQYFKRGPNGTIIGGSPGGGSTPTGTGWVHVTSGVQDDAATTPTAAETGALATSAFSGLAKITVGTGTPQTPGVGDLWIDCN